MVLLILGVSALYRKDIFKNREHPNILKIKALLILWYVISLILSLFILNNIDSLRNDSFHAYALFFLLGLILYTPIQKKYSRKDRVTYYLPIFIGIISVLILAAINKGLTI